jgi:hypothetical protein
MKKGSELEPFVLELEFGSLELGLGQILFIRNTPFTNHLKEFTEVWRLRIEQWLQMLF